MEQKRYEIVLEKLEWLIEFIEEKQEESKEDFSQIDRLFNVDVFRVNEILDEVKNTESFPSHRAKEMNELHEKYKSINQKNKKYIDLLKAGKKIRAIKEYRSETGIGLKEAKDFIDKLQEEHGIGNSGT